MSEERREDKFLTKKEKEKYLPWYKLAREVVNDDYLVPDLSEQKIIKDVSKTDWFIFLKSNQQTKKEAQNSSDPNIWMSLSKPGKIRMGVTYNTLKCVDRALNLLSEYSQEENKKIVSKLLSLDDDYETAVFRKIKDKNHAQSPFYEKIQSSSFQSNKLNQENITNLLKAVESQKEISRHLFKEARKVGKYYREDPTIDIVTIEFNENKQEFIKRFLEMTDILRLCLEIKSTSEIKKIVKKLAKKIRVRQCLTCDKYYKYNYNSKYCKFDAGQLMPEEISMKEYEELEKSKLIFMQLHFF